MTQSIKKRTNALKNKSDASQHKFLLDAIRTELAALRTLANELRTDNATNIIFGSDVRSVVNDLYTMAKSDSIINATTLAIGSNAIKFAVSAFQYSLDGVSYHKAAGDDIVFSAAHEILQYGAIRIQIAADGTVSSKVWGSPQTGVSPADAIQGLPNADAGNVSIGYILLYHPSGTWTANLDDMTAGCDVNEITFVNDAAEVTANVTTTTASTLSASATAEVLAE